MRLLLTRAAADAARTREALETLGHHVIVSPVIETVGLESEWPEGVVDAVLATSGHAFGAPMVEPQPEVRRIVPLYLVGSRTETAARDNGFLGAALVAKNAASLAIAMGKLAHPPSRTLYLAGRDRKPDIETALEVTGRTLEVIEVYEARPTDAPTAEAARALRLHAVDAILHFSRRSASLLAAMAQAHGLDIGAPAHLCLSEDVAIPLREAGLEPLHVAASPSEADLLALVGEA